MWKNGKGLFLLIDAKDRPNPFIDTSILEIIDIPMNDQTHLGGNKGS